MKLITPARRRGFSIVELLVTIALVAALTVMAFQGYGRLAREGEIKQCRDRLSMHGVALGNYLTDKHTWPQEPEGEGGKAPPEKQLWEWWFAEMKPYGIGEDDWYCPTEEKQRKKLEKEGKLEKNDISPSYVPSKFGPGTAAPFNYPNQPWMWERQDFHGQGPHKLMPGGVVQKEFNFRALPRDMMRQEAAPAK